jgi:coniferyl-aldehyde dehydrogenase
LSRESFDLNQAIAYINGRQMAQALYPFTNDRVIQEKAISNTMSGGVCINDCTIHVDQYDLPYRIECPVPAAIHDSS